MASKLIQSNPNSPFKVMIETLIPFLSFLFIMASLASVIVSGLIEYQVISEFYQKHIDSSFFYVLIPIMIVMAFEISKLFLIFFHKQADISNVERYEKSRNQFVTIRFILIFVSFLCTFFFTYYNLYNPEFENQMSIIKEDINEQYNTILNKINQDYEDEMSRYQKQVDYWTEKLARESRNVGPGGVNEGPIFRSYERKLKDAKETLAEMQVALSNQRNQKIAELENWKQAQIDKAAEITKASSVSHQQMIASALKMFNPNYPVSLYVLSIFVITLLISMSLELIIWAGFTFVVIRYDIIVSANRKIQEEEKARALKKIEEKQKPPKAEKPEPVEPEPENDEQVNESPEEPVEEIIQTDEEQEKETEDATQKQAYKYEKPKDNEETLVDMISSYYKIKRK